MRLTTFILLTACISAGARGTAQTITLSLDHAPVQKIFKEVSKQTGISIVYSEAALKKLAPVTIHVKNAGIAEVMDQCLKNQPFDYKIEGNVITVIPRSEKKDVTLSLTKSDMPPPIDVHGRVTNENGEPVAGVTVTIKGTNIGTSTNDNGEFTLNVVAPDMVLVISGVNIETTEVSVNARKNIAVNVRMKTTSMNEIVINKGYYNEQQKYSVSNVGKVTDKDIEKQPVNNPLLALEGRVPGLFITQVNGLPGGGVTVRIQGQNSIENGNAPLYVVDGVPYASQMLPTTTGGMSGLGILGTSAGVQSTGLGGGNPLNFLNPNDIESIEILKDADATAIYGSRAANGAILITTKKGKAGQTKFDVNFQTGWGKVSNMVQMMNTQQYLQMRREAYKNDNILIPSIISSPNDANYDVNGLWDTTRYTNWQKVLIGGTARYSNANGTVSGGNNLIQYLIDATYHRETSVFPGNFQDQKGGVHFNVSSSSNSQKFKLQFSGNYVTDNNKLPATDFTSSSIGLAPNAPSLYNSDGSINWATKTNGSSSWSNPIANLYRQYNNKTNNLISNLLLNYRITRNLDFKTSLGYNNIETNEFQEEPLIAQKPESMPNFSRAGYYSTSTINTWIIEPQLNYNWSEKEHKIEFLIGSTILQQNSNGQILQGMGYPNDQTIEDIKSASSITVINNTIASKYRYNAAFGRINYNLKDRYIINLTGRRDGSSRFGSANQFHDFWSVGAGWIFTNEKFISDNAEFISFGKLRGSYGTTGSDQINDYNFLNLFLPFNPGVPYQNSTGLVSDRLTNPYLRWEETKKMQIGIDLSFLKDRLAFTCNYVQNRSTNQLVRYLLPSTTGYGGITSNFPAVIENTAWELLLSSKNIQSKKIKWQSDFNLTIPHNEVLSFPNLESSSYANRLFIGEPLSVTRRYHYLGIDPATGKTIVGAKNGNPTLAPVFASDAISLTNSLPKIYGGFQNDIVFGSFEIAFLLQFVEQNAPQFLFNSNPGRFLSGINNQPVEILKISHWQKAGDISEFPFFSTSSNNSAMNSFAASDAFFLDASYVRLKTLSIAYTLLDKFKNRARLKSCRVFANAQNIFTITKYKGLDPESLSNSVLPPLRVIVIGFQISL